MISVLFVKYQFGAIHTSDHHHVESATALSHRTYRPLILAMSSLIGLSPNVVQLIIMWLRSHVAEPHTVFALPVAPQMFRYRGGSLSRAHSVGRPPCTLRQCVTTWESFFWVDFVYSLVCYRLLPTVLATSLHWLQRAYTGEAGMLK